MVIHGWVMGILIMVIHKLRYSLMLAHVQYLKFMAKKPSKFKLVQIHQ